MTRKDEKRRNQHKARARTKRLAAAKKAQKRRTKEDIFKKD